MIMSFYIRNGKEGVIRLVVGRGREGRGGGGFGREGDLSAFCSQFLGCGQNEWQLGHGVAGGRGKNIIRCF